MILVTGSSSGIGHALARRLSSSSSTSGSTSNSKRCVQVIATMRAPDECPHSAMEALCRSGCDVYPLDLTDDVSVGSARRYVEAKYGYCDAVVTAAGTGVAGNLETVHMHDAQQVFDVNVWGAMRVARAFAPLLRRGRNKDNVDMISNGNNSSTLNDDNRDNTSHEKNAVFLAVSSQSGVCGLPYNDLYVASKHALEGMLESWRYTANLDVDRQGHRFIHIGVINPGATQTAYGDRLVLRAEKNGHVYDGARAWASEVRRRILQGQPADECARVIEDIIERALNSERVVDCQQGSLFDSIPFRNATSAQSKRVVDSVLRDPAGTSDIYADRFALGRELNRRVHSREFENN